MNWIFLKDGTFEQSPKGTIPNRRTVCIYCGHENNIPKSEVDKVNGLWLGCAQCGEAYMVQPQ